MAIPSVADLHRTSATPDVSKTAVITTATSTTVTGAVDLEGTHLFNIETPGTLASTSITFQALGADGVTYKPIHDQYGTAYSVTVGTNRIIPIDYTLFANIRHFKIVCGSAEANTTTFRLHTRAV